MKTFKWALCLVVIFVAGGVCGGLVSRQFAERRMAFRAGPPGGALAARWLEEMKRRLELTPEQTAQIAPVLTGVTDGFVQKVTAEMLTSLGEANARVLPLLTPVQREKFLQMTQQQEEMIRRVSQGGPPVTPPKP